ncbi:hypothetical protein CJU72_06040 [Pseudomonas fragi]|nr:hypothetical protein CJU72_06040 [Pseudomonas fragi]
MDISLVDVRMRLSILALHRRKNRWPSKALLTTDHESSADPPDCHPISGLPIGMLLNVSQLFEEVGFKSI